MSQALDLKGLLGKEVGLTFRTEKIPRRMTHLYL